MPKAAVTEATNYPIPEGEIVPVFLVSVEEFSAPYTVKTGKNAGAQRVFEKWEWTFKISDGEYAGLELKGSTEPKVTNGDTPSGSLNLARPFVEALLGRELGLGEPVDTDELLGLPAQATVKHLEPRAKKDGNGYWFNVEVDELFQAGAVREDQVPF